MLKKWQRDKLNAWIKEKTIGFSDAQGRYRCPMCGARDSFEITEPVAMLRVGPDGRLKQRVPVVRPGEEESLEEFRGSDQPAAAAAIALRCRNCAFLVFFDAKKVGLMEQPDSR